MKGGDGKRSLHDFSFLACLNNFPQQVPVRVGDAVRISLTFTNASVFQFSQPGPRECLNFAWSSKLILILCTVDPL